MPAAGSRHFGAHDDLGRAPSALRARPPTEVRQNWLVRLGNDTAARRRSAQFRIGVDSECFAVDSSSLSKRGCPIKLGPRKSGGSVGAYGILESPCVSAYDAPKVGSGPVAEGNPSLGTPALSANCATIQSAGTGAVAKGCGCTLHSLMRPRHATSGPNGYAMRQTLLKSTLLWPLWSLILLWYVVVRPGPSDAVYWALAGTTMAALVAQMIGAYRHASEAQSTIDSLSERLRSIGAIVDLSDDEEVNVLVWLDGQQWEDIFRELWPMPAGNRSLRAAILRSHPYVLD